MPPTLTLNSNLAIYITHDIETCDNSNVITQYTKRPPSSTGLAGMDSRASPDESPTPPSPRGFAENSPAIFSCSGEPRLMSGCWEDNQTLDSM